MGRLPESPKSWRSCENCISRAASLSEWLIGGLTMVLGSSFLRPQAPVCGTIWMEVKRLW
jgi:hypothetical protein